MLLIETLYFKQNKQFIVQYAALFYHTYDICTKSTKRNWKLN